jgi:hypothetical protein
MTQLLSYTKSLHTFAKKKYICDMVGIIDAGKELEAAAFQKFT